MGYSKTRILWVSVNPKCIKSYDIYELFVDVALTYCMIRRIHIWCILLSWFLYVMYVRFKMYKDHLPRNLPTKTRCTSFRPSSTSSWEYERTFRNSKPAHRWSHRSSPLDSSEPAGSMTDADAVLLLRLGRYPTVVVVVVEHLWTIRLVVEGAGTFVGTQLLGWVIWSVECGKIWICVDPESVCWMMMKTVKGSHSSGREI